MPLVWASCAIARDRLPVRPNALDILVAFFLSRGRFGVGPAILGGVALAVVIVAAFWMTRPESSATPGLPGAARTVEVGGLARQPADAGAPPPIVSPAPMDMPVPDSAPPATASLEDVIGRIMPAVVLVETATGRGSGFFVSGDTLLTNAHVVGGASSVTLHRSNGTTTTARVASRAPEFDIAILKVFPSERDQVTIPLGSGRTARVGLEVIAIGSALGTLQNTVTRGIVSGIRQTGPATLVQTDAAIALAIAADPFWIVLAPRSGSPRWAIRTARA